MIGNHPGAVAVSDLRFRYRRRGDELFGGLTHTFAPGAITALTGGSGRGKSTLLYIAGLLLRPSAGSVEIGDVSVSRLADRARAHLRAQWIGFVFQDAVLDATRPILDAVIEPALYRGRRRRDVAVRALELLDQVGVTDRIAHRPGQISGGQAQRVALCRCLMNDPAIVLADEPTGNLDDGNSAAVLALLREAADQGRSVIIATHDRAVVRYADEVVAL